MSVREIAVDNDPVLKLKAGEVDLALIPCDEIQILLSDMVATMYAAPGIGLAAPQIKISKRIIVFYLPANRDDVNKVGVELTRLINPIITPITEETCVDYEGCLSVPQMRGKVARYKKIRYTGYSETGEFIERIAEGWHARLVQHEVDHLDGILYPELMAEEDQLITTEAWKALQAVQ